MLPVRVRHLHSRAVISPAKSRYRPCACDLLKFTFPDIQLPLQFLESLFTDTPLSPEFMNASTLRVDHRAVRASLPSAALSPFGLLL